MAQTHAGISRRRVVHGAVWATPAILIATAAPALAASHRSERAVAILTAKAETFKQATYSLSFQVEEPLQGGFTVVAVCNRSVVASSAKAPWVASGTRFTHMDAVPRCVLPLDVTFKFASNDTRRTQVTFMLVDRNGDQVAVIGPA